MKASIELARLSRAIEKESLVHAARVYAGIPTSGTGRLVNSAKQAIVADHFRRGNARRYGWPSLSAKYKAYKARRFPGKPDLVRTGLLRASIVGKGTVSRVGRMVRIRWSSVPDYAHHVKRIRDFVKPDKQDKIEISLAAQRYIDSKVAAMRVKRRGKIKTRG